MLPDGPPSSYRLRAIGLPGRLSTLEAIARALGVLEGPAPEAALERALRLVVERTLWTRGCLPREAVEALPEGARRHA